MDVRKVGCTVFAVFLCLAVVVGEYIVYYSDVFQYEVDAQASEGSVDYTVYSSGSDVYDAVLLSGGTPVDQLRVCVDEAYSEYFEQADAVVQMPSLDQEYMASQILVALSVRGFSDADTVDSDGLREYLESTIGDPTGCAIFVTSYAVPESVYSGNEDDLLIRWIAAGGTLYWTGSEIGRFCVGEGGLREIDGTQELLFGRQCVYSGGSCVATSVIENGFTEALTLKNSNIMFGVDLDGVPGSLEIGYMVDGYASIGLSSYGLGMVCIFAGPFEISLLDDIGQVIAAGVTPGTEIIGHQAGDVVRETVSGSFEVADAASRVYIYIGGTYTKYGGAFDV